MKKSIGILGGMGSMATADLFQKIVLLTRADCDSEHIHIYIDNNTHIPDRTAAILSGGEDPLPEMTAALRNLEKCGADCIIMPCNTAHYFLPKLQRLTKIPFISMLNETSKVCVERFPGKTASILATRGTLQSKLYDYELEKRGVPFILPNESQRDVLMSIIYGCVKSGKDPETVRKLMERLLSELTVRGADYFILGCTELPIVAQELQLSGNFIDPTEALARAAILFCNYEVRQP